MSDHVVQSNNGSDGRAGQSLHSYQSAWMAHWSRTSCNAAPQMHSHLSHAFVNKGDDHVTKPRYLLRGVEVASDFCKSVGSGRKTEAKTFETMNACLTRGSASHIAPYEYDCREDRLNNGNLLNNNLVTLEHEQCNYRGHSALLVCEQKTHNCPNSKKSATPYPRHNNTYLFLNDPSTSNQHSPGFIGEQSQRMQNCFSIGLVPSRNCPSQTTKLETFHPHSIQRMPHSVHDVETMRICTTVDSMEGLPRGPPRISQTTQSVLITKKTDVNLCEGDQIFRESRVSSQFKGNMVGELQSLSPLVGHGQRGVKLKPLDSSMDSEDTGKFEDVKAFEVDLKNESSAETDSMEINVFEERNHFSGGTSSPSNKGMMVDPNLLPQAGIASAREEVGCSRPVMLPDINLELPALPETASSIDNAEQRTSRTQSLDMELLLSHAEQRSSSKSDHCPDGPVRPEPSSRWVKRLKLSASDPSALGTKSSNMGEASSHKKVDKFSKIMKRSITSSELMMGKCRNKELIALDQNTALLRNGESSSADSVSKVRDITLSHSWIKRWRHNRAATPQRKGEAVVLCEPRSLKVALEDLQKKQFPSLAAMALMGKAMSGFQPCEMQKRGSFTVWNTK
ncbi:unnamed protein product [Ilex paraguariensis]|uniref:F-box family protein n=1 Tax=Ilex paraguariensis TaxID=185542 RepID=A0ABC8UQZ9_9AQUA